MNGSGGNNFFHILPFWAHCVMHGSSRHTVCPEVEKIKLVEIVLWRKSGKRCKGEIPHPVHPVSAVYGSYRHTACSEVEENKLLEIVF